MNSQPANITDIRHPPNSIFGEVFEYDRNSNILSLERVYAGEPVQDAAMSYVGNRLTGVNDASMPYNKDIVPSFAAGTYALEYDGDGRLVADGTRGITSIKYTTDGTGLPTRIDLGPDNCVFSSYLPDGTLMTRQFCSVRTRTTVRVNSKGDTIVRTIREPVIDHMLYRGDWEIDGSGTVWRLNTPEGIAGVVKNGAASDAGRTFTHLWYVRDRLGSVRTVLDDNGTIRQCTKFYPSGLPVQLFGTERVTDRAHIGNRWSDFAGLGWHDNIARWHDAILDRFTTPDPKSADYPSFSPYTHCAANPLRFTDPTGMDIYSLNQDGTFVLTMKTDDNFDTIVAESGSNINVPKTFFSSEVSGTGKMEDLDVESGTTSLKDFKYNYYELSGNGMELFEFLANNTNVEWSRLEFSDGNTIIGNSHIEGKDGTCEVFMRNNPERKKLIQAFDHTHPSTDEQSEADVKLVKSIESFAPKATFHVFYSKDFKLFHKYNGNSKGVNLSQPIEMPPFIFEHKK